MATFEDAIAAFRSGATGLSEELSLELLATARDEDDRPAQVDALCMLARVTLRHGELSHAGELAAEARSMARRVGERRLERMPIHMQAAVTRMQGVYAEARILYQESIQLNVQLGQNRMVAAEHRNLGYVELHDGNADRAHEL